MTYVFGTKRLSQTLTPQSPYSAEVVATVFSLASHVGQNQDGTWTSTQQIQPYSQQPKKRKAEGPLMPLPQRRGPPRSTPLQMNGHALNSLEHANHTAGTKNDDDSPSSPEMVVAPQLRAKKRKADGKDNEDFEPGSANHGIGIQEESNFISTAVGSVKRKATANKAAGFVKYHRSMQDDKPAPYGQPPVWADKRQSLCETLPYYRAYMSGAYMYCQIVRAFMVDKEVGPRDKFEEEIMISRV
jgi:hypothetical protein